MSMFGMGKGKADEDFQVASAAQQHPRPAVTQPIAAIPSEADTSIGSDITIIGKIVGKGIVKVFGNIEGELHASHVIVGEGAKIEGSIVAQELTIGGHVKGTIHAGRAKLLSTAKVEGDIFHRSLSIDENALFEGSSRRQDDPIGKKPNGQSAATTPTSSSPAVATPAFNASPVVTKLGGHG